LRTQLCDLRWLHASVAVFFVWTSTESLPTLACNNNSITKLKSVKLYNITTTLDTDQRNGTELWREALKPFSLLKVVLFTSGICSKSWFFQEHESQKTLLL
jgi:hypothetical protein